MVRPPRFNVSAFARRAGAVVLAFVAVASACSQAGGSTATAARNADSLTPGSRWEKVPPKSVGLDGTKLQEIAAAARRGKSNCLVVVRNGKLAGEWYFRGTHADTEQQVFSITKSVASTLVGMAVDERKAKLSQAASHWIRAWRGTPSDRVSLRNLLSNDSGREWSLVEDYARMVTAQNATATAVGLGQSAPPGTVWAYNNSAIQTLEPVLAATLGPNVPAVAKRRLFDPLGMRHSELTTDPSGHALLFQGMRSTCRDLARFGSLMLAQGEWHGRRVVSRQWVRTATGAASTTLNAAYGLLWWLNRRGVLASPYDATSRAMVTTGQVSTGRKVPGAPADMFWALGRGNQVLQIDPGSKTVVVRLGTDEAQPVPPTFSHDDASRVVTEAVRRP
jgi:CubicO group peptidase (beta-lactamase class C family)